MPEARERRRRCLPNRSRRRADQAIRRGGRLSGGEHFVSYVGWPYEYVPASEWDSFLAEQRRLLAAEREGVPGEGLPQPNDALRPGDGKAGDP